MTGNAGAATTAAADDKGAKGATETTTTTTAATDDQAADKGAEGKDLLGGKGDGAAAETTSEDGTEGEPETNEEWWQRFSDGLDKNEQLSWRNTASRYKEPQAFARAHIQMRTQAIFLPKDDDKDRDKKLDTVYERLGRPKESKDYKFDDPKDFTLDDTDKDYRESFRGVAH